MNTAESVEQAYLDLVYARRAVEVVKESLFLARDQARITQIRIDVGATSPSLAHPFGTDDLGQDLLALQQASPLPTIAFASCRTPSVTSR